MGEESKKILITGGAGFIGSHVVRYFIKKYPHYTIYNLDTLTYAGNLENLADIEQASNYRFIKLDIADPVCINALFSKENFDSVIHIAAASHVDRSLENPHEFIRTNIVGTVHLLEAASKTWKKNPSKRFYYISTDEVYGTLGDTGLFTEQTPLNPRSPYAASKAGGDHFVYTFSNSYGLPVIISRCSNNYGPYQFPEKLIPLIINNIIHKEALPVYGSGENIRDWLYVEDHVHAIDLIFHKGITGETYNIGGNNEQKNIDLVRQVCSIMDDKLKRKVGQSEKLITFVEDRPGHDFRYAVDSSKLQNELGWTPLTRFEEGLSKTADWYLSHRTWLTHITSGAYRTYYEKMCVNR